MESITEFVKNSIPKILGVVDMFYQEPEKQAEFEDRLGDIAINFILSVMSEAYTNVNSTIKDSNERKSQWNVVKTEDKTLLSKFGEFSYKVTTFVNKETCENVKIANQYLGVRPHERLTEGAKVNLLKEAVQTSYRRAGDECSFLNVLSKEAVMNYLHALEFPERTDWPAEKKVVKTLFIEADEDHCRLQYQTQKGDLKVNENNYKNNCVLTKIIYVHEGLEIEESKREKGKKTKRHKLKNPYYFCGLYDGEENEKLWKEVYEYISHVYDLEKVEHIYLMSDGGAWIKAGRTMLYGLEHVLDEFHIRKYLMKMTGHMLDSGEDARKEICDIIKNGTREKFGEEAARLIEYTKTEAEKKRVEDGTAYIRNNWSAAKIRLAGRKQVVGCSAEGHVSHVLASRMTSRPMGWCRVGADKMAHLRAYYYNHGRMLELVRAQKEAKPMAAGAEEVILSCQDILNSEKNSAKSVKEKELRKYYDAIQASISLQDRKRANMGGKIVLF